MTLFWIAAAALAGGGALLVMLFARRAAGRVGAENPALAVHRRQLLEIDDLADRGLLWDAEKAAARAEAGRRLLSAAALDAPSEAASSGAARLIALGAALSAGACALGLYMLLGSPGVPDQPYKARVLAWRKSDPATLDAPRMAAVLKTIAADRPNDPEVWGFLGKAEMASGDAFAAEKAFARAARLAPKAAIYQTEIGEAELAALSGKPSSTDAEEIEAAFRRALALDPKDLAALYAFGQMQILAGDRAGGAASWRTLAAALPPGDPRRAALTNEIDRVAAGAPAEAPPAPLQPTTAGAGAAGFIRAMVASLAGKLAAHPDDPAGWAQLVRSYGVLHDAPAQADALAKARAVFSGRPAALQPIEAEAKAHLAR